MKVIIWQHVKTHITTWLTTYMVVNSTHNINHICKVQHVYNIDMVYLTFKYLKYFTYVCAITVCSISMHYMYVPHMCMYQLCAINLYHLYVPHMYVPNVCSINNYVPYIHDICMCYAFACDTCEIGMSLYYVSNACPSKLHLYVHHL